MRKEFHSVEEHVYKNASNDDNRIEFNTNEIREIEIILSPIEVHYLDKIITINNRNKNIKVCKTKDDWFFAETPYEYYKCDQIYGLIELFKEIFNMPN